MKKDHPRGSGITLSLDLKKGTEGKGMIYINPTCFPCRRVIWVSREYLLALGAGIKQQVNRGS